MKEYRNIIELAMLFDSENMVFKYETGNCWIKLWKSQNLALTHERFGSQYPPDKKTDQNKNLFWNLQKREFINHSKIQRDKWTQKIIAKMSLFGEEALNSWIDKNI